MTTGQHPQRCPIRPEVLAFAMRMEMALRDHDKERGDSYKESDSEFLIRRLREEVTELKQAVNAFEDTPWPNKSYLLADPVVRVLSEGADVGNFAMMVSYLAYPNEKDIQNYIKAWNLPCTSHSSAGEPVHANPGVFEFNAKCDCQHCRDIREKHDEQIREQERARVLDSMLFSILLDSSEYTNPNTDDPALQDHRIFTIRVTASDTTEIYVLTEEEYLRMEASIKRWIQKTFQRVNQKSREKSLRQQGAGERQP